jgi:hypothetical protein
MRGLYLLGPTMGISGYGRQRHQTSWELSLQGNVLRWSTGRASRSGGRWMHKSEKWRGLFSLICLPLDGYLMYAFWLIGPGTSRNLCTRRRSSNGQCWKRSVSRMNGEENTRVLGRRSQRLRGRRSCWSRRRRLDLHNTCIASWSKDCNN